MTLDISGKVERLITLVSRGTSSVCFTSARPEHNRKHLPLLLRAFLILLYFLMYNSRDLNLKQILPLISRRRQALYPNQRIWRRLQTFAILLKPLGKDIAAQFNISGVHLRHAHDVLPVTYYVALRSPSGGEKGFDITERETDLGGEGGGYGGGGVFVVVAYLAGKGDEFCGGGEVDGGYL